MIGTRLDVLVVIREASVITCLQFPSYHPSVERNPAAQTRGQSGHVLSALRWQALSAHAGYNQNILQLIRPRPALLLFGRY